MLVVSNTSPIISLHRIGRLDLLRAVYAELVIPEEVRDELAAGGNDDPANTLDVSPLPWIRVHQVTPPQLDQVLRAHPALDIGEAAALAAAIELSADVVLLDDRVGRRAAGALGLTYTGVVGVLLAANAQGHVALVKPILDELRVQAGIYLAPRVYADVLRRAGE